MTLNSNTFPFQLTEAERTSSLFTKSSPSSYSAQKGLAYERKVYAELNQFFVLNYCSRIEHNPWFKYKDFYGEHYCSPDFILHTKDSLIIVEVKLTWVPEARPKLENLYQPVIEKALKIKTDYLIICKTINSKTPGFTKKISLALSSPHKILHWPSIGRLEW